MNNATASGSGESPKSKRAQYNNREMLEELSEFEGVLEKSVKGDNFRKCKYCEKEINVSSGKELIARHCSSRSHHNKLKEHGITDDESTSESAEPIPEKTLEEQIQKAELDLARFVARQNISEDRLDGVAEGLHEMFVNTIPHSEVIQRVSLAKIKENVVVLREQGVGKPRRRRMI